MGVFDTFVPSKPVICPNCGQSIDNNLLKRVPDICGLLPGPDL